MRYLLRPDVIGPIVAILLVLGVVIAAFNIAPPKFPGPGPREGYHSFTSTSHTFSEMDQK